MHDYLCSVRLGLLYVYIFIFSVFFLNFCFLSTSPLPSNRHYCINGDCLEVRGKLSGLFCAVLCVTVVHNAMHTHMNRPNSSLLDRYSLL